MRDWSIWRPFLFKSWCEFKKWFVVGRWSCWLVSQIDQQQRVSAVIIINNLVVDLTLHMLLEMPLHHIWSTDTRLSISANYGNATARPLKCITWKEGLPKLPVNIQWEPKISVRLLLLCALWQEILDISYYALPWYRKQCPKNSKWSTYGVHPKLHQPSLQRVEKKHTQHAQ